NVNVPWRSGLPSAVRAGVHLADWPDAEGTTTVAAKALARATRQGTRMANPPQITGSMAVTVADLSPCRKASLSGAGETAVEPCEPATPMLRTTPRVVP